MRSSIVISFSGLTEGQVVKRRYKPKKLGNVLWIVGSGAGISTGMVEGDRKVGDGAGDDSGVITWLYIVITAICAGHWIFQNVQGLNTFKWPDARLKAYLNVNQINIFRWFNRLECLDWIHRIHKK